MLSRKTRFIIALSALLAAAFLVTSLVSYIVAHDSLRTQVEENTLPLTSDNVYSEIQQDLLRPIFISSLMAQDTFVRDWVLAGEQEEARIIRYLKQIQDRYGAVTSFFVSEATRRYYHSSGARPRPVAEDNPRDAWYFRVRGMRDDYEINVDVDEANRDRVTVFVNYRVYDYAGRYIGATGVGLAVDAVANLIATYGQRYGRRVYFVDRQGDVTLRGPADTGPANIRDEPGLASIATRILSSPSGTFSYERDGRTVYLNSRLVPDFQWFLFVEQDDADLQSGIFNALLGNLAICAGITIVVLVLANLTIGSYQRRLEEMATTDKLTGVANRQVFDVLYGQVVKTAGRSGGKVSLLMLDIDHFKTVNDRYGHPVGDTVIRAVATAVRSRVRQSDVLCRWGGEEFIVLVADCDLARAAQVAETIRAGVMIMPIPVGRERIQVTVSVGVAELQPGETSGDLISRADTALLNAKEAGRNRVHTDPARPAPSQDEGAATTTPAASREDSSASA